MGLQRIGSIGSTGSQGSTGSTGCVESVGNEGSTDCTGSTGCNGSVGSVGSDGSICSHRYTYRLYIGTPTVRFCCMNLALIWAYEDVSRVCFLDVFRGTSNLQAEVE